MLTRKQKLKRTGVVENARNVTRALGPILGICILVCTLGERFESLLPVARQLFQHIGEQTICEECNLIPGALSRKFVRCASKNVKAVFELFLSQWKKAFQGTSLENTLQHVSAIRILEGVGDMVAHIDDQRVGHVFFIWNISAVEYVIEFERDGIKCQLALKAGESYWLFGASRYEWTHRAILKGQAKDCIRVGFYFPEYNLNCLEDLINLFAVHH